MLRQSKWYACGLALCLGTLMPLAFAPYFSWWIAPVSLSGWLLLILWQPSYAGRLGWLLGVGFFSHGIWWVSISLHQYGGAPFVFAAIATAILITVVSTYYAVVGWILGRLACKPFAFFTLVPAIWLLMEGTRAYALSGFPWLALGYSVSEEAIAHFSYPVLGALFTSIVPVWLASVLAALVWSVVKRQRTLWLSFILTGSLWGSVFFVVIPEPVQQKSPISVGVIQGNIAIEDKFRPEYFLSSIQRYVYESQQLQQKQPLDLLVWPETAVAAFYEIENLLFDELRAWANEHQMTVLTGVVRGDAAIGGRYFNSVVRLGEGEDRFYDKHHLLMFGEYLPLRGILKFFRDWVEIPLDDFTAGAAQQRPFDVKDIQVATSICFEGVFGNAIRHQAEVANVLVNISNDAWFGDTIAPHQHFQMIKARTLELARPMVRATNTGISAIIDYQGQIQTQAPLFTTAHLQAMVMPITGLTPYAKNGDQLGWWITVLNLMVGLAFIKHWGSWFKLGSHKS